MFAGVLVRIRVHAGCLGRTLGYLEAVGSYGYATPLYSCRSLVNHSRRRDGRHPSLLNPGKPMTDHAAIRLVNKLKVHRAMHDLTQGELAECVGVTRKSINSIENGHFVPSTELALKMAQVLDCTVEGLFQLPPTSGGVT